MQWSLGRLIIWCGAHHVFEFFLKKPFDSPFMKKGKFDNHINFFTKMTYRNKTNLK